MILQATIGCSYNDCSFCGMYRNKKFRVRPIKELAEEIAWAKDNLPPPRKVFLADGDALMAKARFQLELLEMLNKAFPDLQRVSVYASPQSLQVRTVEEMNELRQAGLTQYYLGVESGNDDVLSLLTKGVDADEMIRVANKANDAEVKLSVMILLGAGGRALSKEHSLDSARVANAINPRFLSTLVMTPVEGTPLWESDAAGLVDELTPIELAVELRTMLAALTVDGTIFRSNHASNYLTLAGTLSKDQPALVAALDKVIEDPEHAEFVPDWLRGL